MSFSFLQISMKNNTRIALRASNILKNFYYDSDLPGLQGCDGIELYIWE